MKTVKQTFLAISLLLGGCAVASAEDVKAGDLVISQAWSRATPGGAKVAGGYFTIENKGAAADRLVSVSADIAGKAEIHEMAVGNGGMKIRPLDKGLVIDPGKTVKVSPRGYPFIRPEANGAGKHGHQGPAALPLEEG